MINYEEALHIAERFAAGVADICGDKLLAVYAIGSLGSDYYRPGQSDIDTAVITGFSREELAPYAEKIEALADEYWKKYSVPKGFGAIVFAKEQLFPPYRKYEELILEIMRLKTQSRLVWGGFDLSAVPFPGKDAIIEDACAFEEWAASEREKDPDFGVSSIVMLVNSTLMILKRYLMIRHDIVEFNKFKVIGLYLEHEPPFVNDEVFDFIEVSLHSRLTEKEKNDRKKLARMIKWHDEIYGKIDELLGIHA